MEPWISVSSTQDANRANGRDGPARFLPVQLEGFAEGPRFAVWWLPAEGEARGSVLCVQPFEGERAAARHVLAAQAWRLAARGWAVLMIDLQGTGDSPDFAKDAKLDMWRNDLLRAALLARQRAHGPHALWGVRGGALLGIDVAAALDQLVDAYVFWQPPEDGATLIDELPATVPLPPALADALKGLHMHPPAAAHGKPPAVLFIETVEEAGTAIDDAGLSSARRSAQAWRAAGYPVQVRIERATAFWRPTTLRGAEPTSLFERTEEFLAGVA